MSSPVFHLALTSEGHASAEAAHRNTAAAGRDLPKEASASLPFLSYSPGFPKPYRSESHGALAPKAQGPNPCSGSGAVDALLEGFMGLERTSSPNFMSFAEGLWNFRARLQSLGGLEQRFSVLGLGVSGSQTFGCFGSGFWISKLGKQGL